jgi:D-alanyl-D-alanine-carboxypeptidase/D-alanyl-D-alanine-endopeptidase
VLADHGVAIFALANRTYAGPSGPVWDAAVAMSKAGMLKRRATPVSADLANAYRAATAIAQQGDVGAGGDVLAMNFLMDRDASTWKRDLAELKAKVGTCDMTAPISASSAMEGEFSWRCTHGRVAGSILLAPTVPARIQQLRLTAKSR